MEHGALESASAGRARVRAHRLVQGRQALALHRSRTRQGVPRADQHRAQPAPANDDAPIRDGDGVSASHDEGISRMKMRCQPRVEAIGRSSYRQRRAMSRGHSSVENANTAASSSIRSRNRLFKLLQCRTSHSGTGVSPGCCTANSAMLAKFHRQKDTNCAGWPPR